MGIFWWRVNGASPLHMGVFYHGGVPHFFTSVPPPISWWQNRGELAGKLTGHNTACELTSPVRRIHHSRTWPTGLTAADRVVGSLANRELHNRAIM